jgi:uncharacterized protein (DUF2236 family)
MTASTTVFGHLEPDADMGFDRRSAIRRITAEPAIGLILQHVLVMDVAHVKVGTGVHHHSLFQRTPWKRLFVTMDAGLRLVWGDPATSRAAARQVYRFHDHVNGETDLGEQYTAHDATLLLWVWATLVEVAEVAHARWLEPLSGDERDAFYADMVSFARSFGIPAELLPADRDAFAAYWDEVIAGDALKPTPSNEAAVREVLWFSHPLVPAPLVRPLRVLSIGTLDPDIRERFGLELDDRDQRLFDRLDGLLARTYRYRPAWLLQRLPELYVSLRRLTLSSSS